MFGNLGEMAKLMQKAKDIQKNMAQLKADMAEAEFMGSAPNQSVQVVVSGDFRVKRVIVSPELKADHELLADLCMVATNQALEGARNAMQERMSELTGGLNLPGLF